MSMLWDSEFCDSKIHDLSTTKTDSPPAMIYTYVYMHLSLSIYKGFSEFCPKDCRQTLHHSLTQLRKSSYTSALHQVPTTHKPWTHTLFSRFLWLRFLPISWPLVLSPLRWNSEFLSGFVSLDSQLIIKSYGSDLFSLVSPILGLLLTITLKNIFKTSTLTLSLTSLLSWFTFYL